MSWGSNDHYQHLYTTHAIPNNTYAHGAIAETYVSTSARSFADPPSYGQSLIADLIREGVSGAKGYVYEPYSNAMAHAYLLYDRYTSGYNLAESYFMASLLISWMDVVVGDPKTSVVFGNSQLPVQIASFNAMLLPAQRAIRFEWRTVSEITNYGFFLQRKGENQFADVPNSFVPGHGTTLEPRSYSWMYANAPSGSASYRLRQIDLDGTEHFSDPIQVAGGIVATASNEILPTQFELHQNYPNPFNPKTEIMFNIADGGFVSLRVYDAVGKEVAMLVNEELPPGRHQRTFDPDMVGSGVYYYRLTAGTNSEAKRMLLLK
jgi:hypothetical protein